jgi:hypothetical protein
VYILLANDSNESQVAYILEGIRSTLNWGNYKWMSHETLLVSWTIFIGHEGDYIVGISSGYGV